MTTTFASPTHAAYSEIRDQLEQLHTASAHALRQAERLDLDAADHLTAAQKLAAAQGLLAGFWAVT